MSYSHCNGEIEMPTIDGLYWFDGQALLWTQIDQYKEMVSIENGDVFFATSEEQFQLKNPVGRWWGPILPPWESDDE